MDERFQKIVTRTLQWEGGFVDNPNDPGGRTNKGITQKEYNQYRVKKGLQPSDVLNITDSEVYEIYFNDYFIAVSGELFADSIKTQWKIFDIAVNMGVSRSLKFVQKIIGVVPDGDFGPTSKQALIMFQHNRDWGNLMLQQLVKLQSQRYQELATANPKLAVFLKGWLRRANDAGDGLN